MLGNERGLFFFSAAIHLSVIELISQQLLFHLMTETLFFLSMFPMPRLKRTLDYTFLY